MYFVRGNESHSDFSEALRGMPFTGRIRAAASRRRVLVVMAGQTGAVAVQHYHQPDASRRTWHAQRAIGGRHPRLHFQDEPGACRRQGNPERRGFEQRRAEATRALNSFLPCARLNTASTERSDAPGCGRSRRIVVANAGAARVVPPASTRGLQQTRARERTGQVV